MVADIYWHTFNWFHFTFFFATAHSARQKGHGQHADIMVGEGRLNIWAVIGQYA